MTSSPTLIEPFGPVVAELRLAAERARQEGGIASIEARLILVLIAILGTLEALYLSWKASIALPQAAPRATTGNPSSAQRITAPMAPRTPNRARHHAPARQTLAPQPAPDPMRHRHAAMRPPAPRPCATIRPFPTCAPTAPSPRRMRPPWPPIPGNGPNGPHPGTPISLRCQNKLQPPRPSRLFAPFAPFAPSR